ncbi:MAG: hypothetical protein WEB19_03315 [Acidimicrobiia bacterium]
MSERKRRFALRSVDLTRRLDIFLVCAVASVLGNRTFLIITGYPQLGNGTLHISHAIWGALMMMIALFVAIAYLPPKTRTFVAFLGGAGFGWFIDELGKFITQKVNYFYQPTIALIYIVFIVIYLVSRNVERRNFTADEAVLNGLETLKSASLGELDETRRTAALELMQTSGATGKLADDIRDLLADVPALPPSDPGRFGRAGAAIRTRYLELGEKRGFVRTVNVIMITIAVGKVITALSLALDRSGVHGFADWASVISSLISGGFIVVGCFELRRSHLRAYRWFDRGLLVEILVTQVFVFAKYQLEGIFGLAFTIILWLFVRSAMRAEQERDTLAAIQAAPIP